MALITRGSIESALRPGIHDWYGLGYKLHPEQYTQIYKTLQSSMNYERDVNMYGLGVASVRPEGTASTADTMAEGFAFNYVHIDYSNMFLLTHQAQRDNQYMKIAEAGLKELGNSMREYLELAGSNLLNLAFSNTVTYADGLELCSTANLLSGGGTFSNKLAVDADFSEASLEQAMIDLGGAVNDRSLPREIKAQKLIIHRSNMFEADRVLKTELRVGTAENDINAIRAGSYLPGGSHVNHRLTDADAWFLITDCPQGMQHFQREAVRVDSDTDFHTDNIYYKAVASDSFGCTNKWGIFASAGA